MTYCVGIWFKFQVRHKIKTLKQILIANGYFLKLRPPLDMLDCAAKFFVSLQVVIEFDYEFLDKWGY